MYYLIFTIILFGAAFYLKNKANKNGYPGTDYLLVGIIITFWLFYLFDYLKSAEGIILDRPLTFITSVISDLLVPGCYIFVCKHCNIKIKSATTVGVFALILFNIIASGTVFLDWYPSNNIDASPGIHFYRKGRELITMETFEIVMVLQLIWILVRTYILWNKAQKERLKTSQKGKIVFLAIIITAVLVFIDCFISEDIKRNTIMLIIHFTEHLSIAIALMYFVSNGYMEDVIVDENEEVAYLDIKPKYSEIRIKLEQLMREKRLYLDKNISLEVVTKLLNTNRTYLSQLIKDSYGTSFTGYINNLRIEEAKRIIKENKANKLEEVAELCGFNTASTFTRTFKAITGVTPHMWR